MFETNHINEIIMKKINLFFKFLILNTLCLVNFSYAGSLLDRLEGSLADTIRSERNLNNLKLDKVDKKISETREIYKLTRPGQTVDMIAPIEHVFSPVTSQPIEDPTLKKNTEMLVDQVRQSPALGLTSYVSSDRILNGLRISRKEIVSVVGITDIEKISTNREINGECTGVLIDNQHFLTARHCVCNSVGIAKQYVTLSFRGVTGDDSPIPASFLGAYSGNGNDSNPCPFDEQYQVVPKEAREFHHGRDIAIYRLDIPVTNRDPSFIAPQIMLHPTNPPKPSLGLVSGYGITKVDKNGLPDADSARRGLMGTLVATSADCGKINECVQNNEFVSISASGNDSCNGDSGGPFYLVDQEEIKNLKEKFIDNSPQKITEKIQKIDPEKLSDEFSKIQVRLYGVVSRGLNGKKCGEGGIYTAITKSVVEWIAALGANPEINNNFNYYNLETK